MSNKSQLTHYDEHTFPFDHLLEEFEESPGDYTRHDALDNTLFHTLTGSFEEKLDILREAIEEIDSEIGVRKNLHRTFQEGFTQSKQGISGLLREFDYHKFGYKPSVDFRRTALEKELLNIDREIRAEHQRAFSDIVLLKKQRRAFLIQYQSLKATEKALAP